MKIGTTTYTFRYALLDASRAPTLLALLPEVLNPTSTPKRQFRLVLGGKPPVFNIGSSKSLNSDEYM